MSDLDKLEWERKKKDFLRISLQNMLTKNRKPILDAGNEKMTPATLSIVANSIQKIRYLERFNIELK